MWWCGRSSGDCGSLGSLASSAGSCIGELDMYELSASMLGWLISELRDDGVSGDTAARPLSRLATFAVNCFRDSGSSADDGGGDCADETSGSAICTAESKGERERDRTRSANHRYQSR